MAVAVPYQSLSWSLVRVDRTRCSRCQLFRARTPLQLLCRYCVAVPWIAPVEIQRRASTAAPHLPLPAVTGSPPVAQVVPTAPVYRLHFPGRSCPNSVRYMTTELLPVGMPGAHQPALPVALPWAPLLPPAPVPSSRWPGAAAPHAHHPLHPPLPHSPALPQLRRRYCRAQCVPWLVAPPSRAVARLSHHRPPPSPVVVPDSLAATPLPAPLPAARPPS